LGNWYGFHVLAPYPGTEVRERAEELGLKILHNDWLRYDANQAVSETKDVSADYINKVAKDFYQSLEKSIKAIEEILDRGEEPSNDVFTKKDIEDVKLRKKRKLIWYILKHDYLERKGSFNENGDPVELLAEKLHKIKYVSSIIKKERIAEEIKGLLQEGDINYTRNENGVTWYWAKVGEQSTVKEKFREPSKSPATV
jgi:hypothetical protein